MVRIVTDSTCDFTEEQVEQLGISAVAALYVRFGDESYQDGIAINREQFHRLLKTNPNFPTTSQPSIGDFMAIYERFPDDEIVSIHVCRDLSGTLASAEAARDLLGAAGRRITLIDSRSVNAGLALLVKEAAEMTKAGASAEEIKAQVESLIPRNRLIFAVETLENLRRGGRIGNAQAFLGSMLQFKPIIAVRDGRLEPLERVRTMPKAVKRLVEIAAQELHAKPHTTTVFMHAAAPSAAEELKAVLMSEVNLTDTLVIEAGPVIATHTGAGAVGIAYLV